MTMPDNIQYCLLIDCVIHNDLEGARILIPQCDCAQQNSYLLQLASCHQHQEMFDLLYPLSNAQEALDDLSADNTKDIANGADPEVYLFGEILLRERLAMEQMHANLTEAASGAGAPVARAKKL